MSDQPASPPVAFRLLTLTVCVAGEARLFVAGAPQFENDVGGPPAFQPAIGQESADSGGYPIAASDPSSLGGSRRYAPTKKHTAPTNVPRFTKVRLITSSVVGSVYAAIAEIMKKTDPT
jgi:hypothetical protein